MGDARRGNWCASRADKNGLIIDARAMSVTAAVAQARDGVEVAVRQHTGRGYAVSESTLSDRDGANSALGSPEPLSAFRPTLWRRRSFRPTTLVGRQDECRVLDGLL